MKEFNVIVLLVSVIYGGINTTSLSHAGFSKPPMGVQSNPKLIRSGEFPSDTKILFSKTGSCRSCGTNRSLSDYLWNQTSSFRESALRADFLKGIKAGTLNPTYFGGYMLQDAVWMEKASTSISLAAKRVAYTQGLHLRAFLLQKAINYQGYADDLYKKWHIDGSSSIQLNGGGKAYAEYEYLVASTMDVGYFMICMTPCLKLWPWLGSQLIKTGNETFGAYTDWVYKNFDPKYDGYKKVEHFFNQMYAAGELDKQTALTVFQNCIQGEVDFFKYAV